MKNDPWEESLRDAASRLKRETPEGLEQRISRAVADSGRPRKPVAFFSPAAIIFAAAACAAVAFYVSQRTGQAVAPELAAADTAAPGQADGTPFAGAPNVLQKDPLQDEADAAMADAHSAMDFLAANFLPSQTSG